MATLPPFNLDGFGSANSAEAAAIKRIVDYLQTTNPGGGAGIAVYGDLVDAPSVDLPVINTPLANALGSIAGALNTKQPTLVAGTGIQLVGTTISATGGATAASTAYSLTIPLDTVGAGKLMPQTQFTTSGAIILPGGSPVDDATCRVCYVGDGSAEPDFSKFTNLNSFVYDATLGARNLIIYGYLYGNPVFYGAHLEPVDLVAPTVPSITVSNATPTQAVVLFDDDMDQTQSAAGFFTAFGGTTSHAWTSSSWGDTARKLVLVTPTPFVNGESAKTVTFTQNGSINLQDLAGNKLATFTTPQAITNNVNALPTITGIAISNSTPDRAEFTLSENYSGVLPAASAITISGKTVSSLAAGSTAAKFVAIVSANFVSGATHTAGYTKPGVNPITGATSAQQLATFSGMAITNNVAAPTGSLTLSSHTTASAFDYTTLAGTNGDWIKRKDGPASYRKSGALPGVNSIVETFTNLAAQSWSHQSIAQTWTDGGNGSESSSVADGMAVVSAGSIGTLACAMPASTAVRHGIMIVRPDGGSDSVTVRGHLSDNSAPDITVVCQNTGSEISHVVDMAYQAAGSTTFVMTLELQAGVKSTHDYCEYDGVIYKP